MREVSVPISSLPIEASGDFGDRDDLIGLNVNNMYKIERLIGEGANGRVYIVNDENENVKYVCRFDGLFIDESLKISIFYSRKVIKFNKKQSVDDKVLKEVLKEVEILCKVNHDYLVEYYEHFKVITTDLKAHLCIITAYYNVIDNKYKIDFEFYSLYVFL